MTIESRKGCRTAAFEVLGVLVGDGEVDAEREESEDESEDGEENVDTEREIIPESNVVETELGCAVSTEDGTGIEDVNPGTGDWNEPLIRSSLNQRLVNRHQGRQRAHEREAGRKCYKRVRGIRCVDRGELKIAK